MGRRAVFFQMEPATHDDIWTNFIDHRPPLKSGMEIVFGAPDAMRLEYDLHYSAMMCRIHYYRVPDPLPAWNDLGGMADYWKEHYNTHLGAGDALEFVKNYERYVE